MKAEDRSLDIAVIGLGQAGGNLAAQFSQRGYRVIALNTALTDLSALGDGTGHVTLAPEQRVYIGIDGYDGAGGDVNYGRECIRENADRIRKAVMEHVSDADLVLIAAGLGGGTGSSASELVKTIEDMQLPIIVMATLPTENESGMAKVNAMRGANALVQNDQLSWIFVDNSRLAKHHSEVGMDRYFETINSYVVEPLDALNRLNHIPDLVPIRTLDGEDLRRLLLAGGVINYASVHLPGLEITGVVNCIRSALQSSSIMPAGYSLEQVATIGVVIQAPDEVLSRTPFSFFERLNENIKQSTNGAASYLGVYRDRSKGSSARLRLVCSSQQLPDGVLAMVNDARREGGVLRDKLHQTLSPLDVSELEEFDLFRTNVRTSSASKTRRRRSLWPDMSEDAFDTNAARARRPQGSLRSSPPSMPPETRAPASSVPKSSLVGSSSVQPAAATSVMPPSVTPPPPPVTEVRSSPGNSRPSDYQALGGGTTAPVAKSDAS